MMMMMIWCLLSVYVCLEEEGGDGEEAGGTSDGYRCAKMTELGKERKEQ